MVEKGKRGRPKKDEMIVDTNVRMTKKTHTRLKTLADLWDVSISKAVDRLIDGAAPEVDDVIRQRDEQRKRFSGKSSQN